VSAPEPQFELRGVAKRFRRGDIAVAAVDGVELDVAAGELVAIEGPSGSGKTTLLQLLGALDRPDEGRILFEGRDLAESSDNDLAHLRLHAFGFVFQQFNLIPTLSALENIEAVLAPTGLRGDELRARAGTLLEEVGLAARAEHVPSHLSGGEQQRVAIARALANEPQVILADEPTGNLDSKTGGDVIDLLAGLAGRRGTTVVVATHDVTLAARAPRRVAMRDGRIVEDTAGPPHQSSSTPAPVESSG
jgi:putative ABC transport system ATP-binding protein